MMVAPKADGLAALWVAAMVVYLVEHSVFLKVDRTAAQSAGAKAVWWAASMAPKKAATRAAWMVGLKVGHSVVYLAALWVAAWAA